MNKDEMLKLVKATRMSLRLSKDMEKLFYEKHGLTVADQISGFLADALFSLCGEHLTAEQDFRKHSMVWKLLTLENMSDEYVATELLNMSANNVVKQPAPKLMTDVERKALYETPEGEWR